jgi:hypothetical protein
MITTLEAPRHSGFEIAPWQIDEERFPAEGDDDWKLAWMVRWAVLAPSGHNAQPWVFRIDNGTLELYADRTRRLPVCDPDDREMTIGCGAALFHLWLALRHSGYAGDVEVQPEIGNVDLLARVRLGELRSPKTEEELLFAQVRQRHTHRGPFDPRPLPPKLIAALQTAAAEEGAWFQVLEDEEMRNAVADLVSEGDRLQWSDPAFRNELAAWTHPNYSRSHDGIPGYALGMSDAASLAGPQVIRTFDLGHGRAARDRELAAGSPVLAVLGTGEDDPLAWLEAGEALARVLLRARRDGVWASFLNQPIEVPELRVELQRVIGRAGHPQMLLRLGFSAADPLPTPRRGAAEVIWMR